MKEKDFPFKKILDKKLKSKKSKASKMADNLLISNNHATSQGDFVDILVNESVNHQKETIIKVKASQIPPSKKLIFSRLI